MGYFILGILTGGVFIYVLVDARLREKLASKFDKDRNSSRQTGARAETIADELAGAQHSVPSISYEDLLEAARNEFSPYAKRFEGLYERLYQSAQGGGPDKTERVLNEWIQKLERFDLQAVLAVWGTISAAHSNSDDAGSHRTKEWLGVLTGWGIQRDREKEVQQSELTARFYDFFDGEGGAAALSEERLFLIVVPCWTWGDSVVERGIARSSPSITV